MKFSLKARNVPKLAVVWLVNVTVFSGVVTGVLDVRDVEALRALVADLARDPWTGLPYAGVLTLVSIFNGMLRRSLKERLVFWPDPRPGSRAFSQLMFKDSTIDRKALEEHFGPLPTDPVEQNVLWLPWLHEFEDDARVRPTYGWYLFARDWMAISVVTLVLAGPLALWFAHDPGRAIWYGVVLLGQCALARQLARVQGEQFVMSVLSCKASSLVSRSSGKGSSQGI